MKFEKLSENKIRITLTLHDFENKNIDFHDFMSNPLETQDLFLDILEEAKHQIGFNTTNYKVKIEALAMIDGDFVVNVTRIANKEKISPIEQVQKKKFKVHRKTAPITSNASIYKFDNFDDYCAFIEYLSKNNLENAYLISKKVTLYTYKDSYYLILENISEQYKNTRGFSSAITEFATYLNNSALFISKLYEFGKLVMKHNAIKISLKHFIDLTKKPE